MLLSESAAFALAAETTLGGKASILAEGRSAAASAGAGGSPSASCVAAARSVALPPPPEAPAPAEAAMLTWNRESVPAPGRSE